MMITTLRGKIFITLFGDRKTDIEQDLFFIYWRPKHENIILFFGWKKLWNCKILDSGCSGMIFVFVVFSLIKTKSENINEIMIKWYMCFRVYDMWCYQWWFVLEFFFCWKCVCSVILWWFEENDHHVLSDFQSFSEKFPQKKPTRISWKSILTFSDFVVHHHQSINRLF